MSAQAAPPDPIYLDYNATTPVDPEVWAAMRPYLEVHWGNPSSAHTYGWRAREAVEEARAQVAALIGAQPHEIVFTGGGSEADNLALQGVAFARADRGRHIVTTAVEHPAVLASCRYLQRRHGFSVTVVPVDGRGRVDPTELARAVRPDTIVVSVMHAQNEVGTIQPVEEIAERLRPTGVVLHTDAAQSVGKIPVNVLELGVDLLTIAGHKLYAPKGVGALYVRGGPHGQLALEPLIHGGGQEGGLRAGTENVAGIVGLGKACALAAARLGEEAERVRQLRDLLEELLLAQVPGLQVSGDREHRLPGTLHVTLPPGGDAQRLLGRLDTLAISAGSACHAGHAEPSGVLLAMGMPAERALGGLRISLGRFTTEEEVREAARILAAAVRAERAAGA